VPELNVPEDLTGLSDEELTELSRHLVEEFDGIYAADGGPRASDVVRATELADHIERLTGEQNRRTQVAAEAAEQLAQLRERVNTATTTPDTEDGAGDGDTAGDTAGEEPATTQEPALVADSRPAASTAPARTAPRETGGFDARRGNLNASLRDAQRNAPAANVPAQRGQDLVITAAAATSGAPIGSQIDSLEALSRFIHQHARSLTVTNGNPAYTPFATIQRRVGDVLGEHTDPHQVLATLNRLSNPEVLVAAGGWCSPSDIRYGFFNIACQARTGLIDLPTFGVDRGGVRWPTSPSLADVLANPTAFVPFTSQTFNAASMPWLWTETSDILAVTGGATKPCIRVPCPTFEEARLECFGHCVTAGNLADSSYPENTANFLTLLMAAQLRVENFRYLAQMASMSTLSPAASGGLGAAGSGVIAPVLGAIEMQATDYRTKYGMCDDDLLEAVFPIWIKAMVRSDLAKRAGMDLDAFRVTDGMIADWFDSRGVRAQFVGEYQARTAGYPGLYSTTMTAWPTQVEFLLYAAGTFQRGDGMSLDLGVVRDSVLNATNDHTAAWAEACHLIAKFGHESRRVIVNICPDGTTGAADLTACGL